MNLATQRCNSRPHLIINVSSRVLVSLLTIFLFFSKAQAQDLQNLYQWSNERSGWRNDPSEIGYVTVRCGALFQLVGFYISENKSNDENISISEKYNEMASKFLKLGLARSISLGISDENIIIRFKSLSDIYSKNMVVNKNLYNNAFYGIVSDDLKFCSTNVRHLM